MIPAESFSGSGLLVLPGAGIFTTISWPAKRDSVCFNKLARGA